jgi:chromosome segregation ATPase
VGGGRRRREARAGLPLNDYAKIFHIFYRRREDLADKIEFITRETASIEASTKLAETQVMRGMDEQTKLMADQTNYKLEQEAITKLEAELQAQSAELKKRLTETYLLNQQLAAELAALQKQMSDELAKETPKTAALTK